MNRVWLNAYKHIRLQEVMPLMWRLQSEEKMFLRALSGRDILTSLWYDGSQTEAVGNTGTGKWGHFPKRQGRVIFRR
jgi:hypothetical protein